MKTLHVLSGLLAPAAFSPLRPAAPRTAIAIA